MSDSPAPQATLAFVGCAHIHTPGFINAIKKRSGAVRVKSVWDHDEARAKMRADELPGATVQTDLDAILSDGEITGVVVCTETNRHADVVVPIAQAKKHLFVEKPLGFAADDAFQMARAINEAGVLFQTGYFMRGDSKTIFLRRQIEAGAFGKITRIRGSNCHGGALGRWFDTDWRWMTDKTQSGVGAFGDLGTHSLDILLWLMDAYEGGSAVEKATALLNNGTGAYGDCDETGEGLLQFENGVIGTLAAAWDDVANPVTLQISGTEGNAAVINGQLYFTSKHVEGADGKTPWEHLPSSVPGGFEAFLTAVSGQRDTVLVTPDEAATRSAVMEALYEGAAQNAWVAPKKA